MASGYSFSSTTEADNNTLAYDKNGRLKIISVPPVDVSVTNPITNNGTTIGLNYDNATLNLSSGTGAPLQINLAHTNTWTGVQTFPVASFNNLLSTANTWTGTQTFPVASFSNLLSTANTWTGVQTFGNNISIGGATLDVTSLATNDVLQYNGTNWVNATVSSGVSSVSNSNGSLTISPTTGSVVASLNTANANTWTATQTISTSSTVLSASFSNGIQISGQYNPGPPIGNANIFVASSSTNSQALRILSNANTTGVSGDAIYLVANGNTGAPYLEIYWGGTTASSKIYVSNIGAFNSSAVVQSTVGFATTAGAATTVSVGASPYTYTNSSASNQQIFIQGGTVSAISFNPNGGTGIALSGLTDNVITMRPNDTLTITYTAAPTVNTIQL